MSYPMRELQGAIWAPFLPWLHAAASFLVPTDDALCVTPVSQFAAGCDLLVRLCQRYPKPTFGLTDTVVGGTPVASGHVWRTTIYAQLRELICQQVRGKRRNGEPTAVRAWPRNDARSGRGQSTGNGVEGDGDEQR